MPGPGHPASGSGGRQQVEEVRCGTGRGVLRAEHRVQQRARKPATASHRRRTIAHGESSTPRSHEQPAVVADFGEGILAAPQTHGFGLLAWILRLVVCSASAPPLVSSRGDGRARVRSVVRVRDRAATAVTTSTRPSSSGWRTNLLASTSDLVRSFRPRPWQRLAPTRRSR